MNQSAKRSRSEKDFDAYQFLLHFAEEYAAFSEDDQRSLIHREFPNSIEAIQLPAGATPFTSECRRRLRQVTERAMRTLGEERAMHSEANVVKELKSAVEARFRTCGISKDDAHLVVDECIAEMRTRYKPLTQFVPCVLFLGNPQVERVEVGPVEFIPMAMFLDTHQQGIREVAGRFGDGAIRRVLPHIERYLTQFDWMAVVDIPECDPDRSAEFAQSIVQLALDAVKASAGRKDAKDVRPAYSLQNETEYAILSQGPEGGLRVGLGSTARGLVFDKAWYEALTKSPGWTHAGELLDRLLKNLGQVGELDSRFLDALRWHSDAISETNRAAAVAKFWFAIERLTVVDMTKGASVRRAARIVCWSSQDEDAQRVESIRREIAGLKSLRDKIAHGNAGLLNHSVPEDAVLRTEAISRSILFQYLERMPSIRGRSGATEKQRFAAWLKEME